MSTLSLINGSVGKICAECSASRQIPISHYAAKVGHLDCLTNSTIDPNELDSSNRTAFHWACFEGRKLCADYLIQKGVDLYIEVYIVEFFYFLETPFRF